MPDVFELNIPAQAERLPEVLSFLEWHLEESACPMKTQMQIMVAAEEIFVNIASYAYPSGTGMAAIRLEISGEPTAAVITFQDSGCPFDPLAKADPDVSLPAEERSIGGLGIFMTKKLMDDVRYEHRNGKNILTIKKNLQA